MTLNKSVFIFASDGHIMYQEKILEDNGYTVYPFTNQSSAYEFLENIQPDIIIISAEKDNSEICRKIKRNEKLKDISVIFILSERNPEIIKNIFAEGGSDYIAEPFTKEEYLAKINNNIENFRHKQELERAVNELELFCTSVSHDLKSPLNSLMMLADTLKDEAYETGVEGISETADMIVRKTSKITEMIDCLLKFSRMCNLVPELEEINIEALFHDIFNELKSAEPERDITMNCDSLPFINGDDVLTEILVNNLMTNAFKFTSLRDKAVIDVKYIPDNRYHIIKIRDNGIGFDMAYYDKIFMIFQRLHGSENFEGNGAGLALCKRIMIRHGGKIEAYGESGNGAEFKVYFPK